MRGVIGLDFGTTNTLCAWMDGDTPIIVPNDRGERATPSVVAVSGSGEALVGSSARNQALADPASALFGVKRLLGKSQALVFGGRERAPEEAAAAIIGKVKRDAESYLGFEADRAVITVPARYGDRQRRAVRDAAAMAGLKAARVMNEPSAAALAKAWLSARDESERLVLVYDFGGGTFDATALRARGGSCSVLSSEGDDALGGMDIDAAIYETVAERFRLEFGIDPSADPYLARTLVDLCERAKIELSSRDEATIAVPFLRGAGGVVHPSVRLERAAFEAIASPFIDRSLALVERVLRTAKAGVRDVDALVLSGGSSRIPLAKRRLAELLGRDADPRINPEEIVALGAAVEAARIEGRLKGLSFTDVCSRTFGLEIDGGSFVPLIVKDEPLPAVGRRVFTTVEDYQRSVELHVLQGESERASDNASVGRFLLPGIRKATRGEPRIAVEFAIDEGDMMIVRARDLDTGAEQSIAVFDGERDSRSPRDRVLALAQIVRRESAEAIVDAALGAEIGDVLAMAESCGDDDEKAAMVATLLEGLLSELSARTGRSEADARRPSELPFRGRAAAGGA
ncbi:MAG TPA: Hsp70 family protein [Spirochaetales bacterium]|nr:Hsp70 family protein [Spirochaetales bacterium]HPG86446.1 Hsp70 family protein [Spirochaetales bacterium]